MEAFTLSYVAKSCEGEVSEAAAPTWVQRVCTDTRRLQAGDLFVALSGPRHDGHDYLAQAEAKGAAAAMVERHGAGESLTMPCVRVADTRQALGGLAACYRRKFVELPIVAIGGSNGKTTTKEILAAILAERYLVLKSPASYNNDIGVPLTLLELESGHQAAVLEVGTNHPGELGPLLRIIKPRFGILTSIGREHLEHFHDLAGVAEEEGWLAEQLPADGMLFANGESPLLPSVLSRTRAQPVLVGRHPDHSWRIDRVDMKASGTVFSVQAPAPAFSGEYWLPMLGRHQVINAVLAMAAAAELGLSAEELRRGLAACPPVRMRLQVAERQGARILNDAYNANADSMQAALETLRQYPCQGRRIAILGDMAEVGETGADLHAEVGRETARLGIDRLIAIGEMAAVTAQAARGAGLSETMEFANVEAAAEAVPHQIRKGDVVLLKASRAACMERLLDYLSDPPPPRPAHEAA